MNGYKILKCFRKEKRVSGELPCLATGLIHPVRHSSCSMQSFSKKTMSDQLVIFPFKMCMKKFDVEKIFLTNLWVFLT